MLGSMFLKHLAGIEDFEMFAFDRSTLDVADSDKLAQTIKRLKPDFLINCTAFTDVDGAEANRDLAMKINGEACGVIAKSCKETGTVMIHFSTDYVFDGEKSEGYSEDDETNPINVYGQSKLAGEKLIQQNCDKFYIVRTSWLYGENGKNFVATMLRLAESKKELDVVDDQVGSPTYTADLCKAVINNFLGPEFCRLEKVHNRSFDAGAEYREKTLPFGIYHLTNSGSVSWHDFAEKIFELSGIEMKVNRTTSEQFARPAKRPKFSTLINTKLSPLRAWEDALKSYLRVLPKA